MWQPKPKVRELEDWSFEDGVFCTFTFWWGYPPAQLRQLAKGLVPIISECSVFSLLLSKNIWWRVLQNYKLSDIWQHYYLVFVRKNFSPLFNAPYLLRLLWQYNQGVVQHLAATANRPDKKLQVPCSQKSFVKCPQWFFEVLLCNFTNCLLEMKYVFVERKTVLFLKETKKTFWFSYFGFSAAFFVCPKREPKMSVHFEDFLLFWIQTVENKQLSILSTGTMQ